MKRACVALFAVALAAGFAACSLNADSGKSFTLRVSYFSPEAVDAGFSLGGSVGTMFDEVVELGLGTDIFWRNYTKRTVTATNVTDGGLTYDTTTRLVEYNTVIVPLMLELMLKFPAFPGTTVFGHGGLGYELLFNKERNFTTDTEDNRTYSGFTWQLGGGLMLRLGHSSSLYAEGYYDHGKPKRNLKKAINGLPVVEEVNLSGFGARIGLSLGPL